MVDGGWLYCFCRVYDVQGSIFLNDSSALVQAWLQQRMMQEGSGGLETSLVSSKRTGPSVSPGWEMML